ncbi:polygalacturonase [Anaerotaenia torta]|uniref:glycoside hydrolase family 28 protein n=1 Tax=Anaerotaenia torta TaxID=433293 RepID=UPI003D229EAC
MDQLMLYHPSGARTATSLALVWDKVPGAECYQVLLNGRMEGIAACTDYTAEQLRPETSYICEVRAVARDGKLLAQSNTLAASTKRQGELFDIRDFGAKGDGITLNTEAIQAAINACSEEGIVYIPEGVFLTGALHLKSNMTLFIEKLGRLLGSADPADYPLTEYLWEGRKHLCYTSLLNAHEKEQRYCNITIAGEGTIDANGMRLFHAEMEEQAGKRGRALYASHVDGLYLKDITVRQSPSWCIHPVLCTDVSMNHIKVYTREDEFGNRYKDIFNGDGIDPESCRDVVIFHSLIASQDDCIAVKSGRDEDGRKRGVPSENIRITNCTFLSGFGVAMGSEMSGGIRNVLVQDCVFEDAYSVGSVKAPLYRGGVIENITYADCRISNYGEHRDTRWFRGAIYVDQYYHLETFDPDESHPVTEGTPVIRNITFRNIVLDTATGNAIFLAGLPEAPLENITLENVTALGKTGMKAYNIDGLHLKNVSVSAREGEAVMLHNVNEE